MHEEENCSSNYGSCDSFSMPLSASAAWKKDVSGSWKWLEGSTTQTGWKWISGKWYSFDSQGIMTTGWLKEGNTWYYLEQNGAMKTGWLFYNGTWYYLRSNGAMATGWQKIDGVWYYFKEWGGMATGWVTVNGKRYFLASSGAMQTGIIEIDGSVYYFGEDGASVTGKVRLNGKTYTFAETGEAAGWRKPQPDKAFDSAGKAAEITLSGGYSGGGSAGSGGSSSGGSSGGTGGGSESGDKTKIRVENGYWEDTEEGLKFSLNDGYYMLYDLNIRIIGLKFDSVEIDSLSVQHIFGDPSNISGEIQCYPEGSKLIKTVKLFSASLDEAGALVLRFMDLDIDCTLRLRCAEDHKSVTLLGISSEGLYGAGMIEGVEWTYLSDTTRTVASEQEIREALADETVTNIVMWDTVANTFMDIIDLKTPLTIDRDVEFSTIMGKYGFPRKAAWVVSKDCNMEGTPVITITNGAKVTFRDISFAEDFRLNSIGLPTFFEVVDSELCCENGKIGDSDLIVTNGMMKSVDTLIIGENAKIVLSKMTLSNEKAGIQLDSRTERGSSLKVIDPTFKVKGKLIVSNSANTTVVLPGNFVEFTNAEGQREWTDDASKIPAAE